MLSLTSAAARRTVARSSSRVGFSTSSSHGLSSTATAQQQSKEQDEKKEQEAEPASTPVGPKVIVLGGSGYVGSHVLQALLQRGADPAVSVNRSGMPSHLQAAPWATQVQWVKADVFDDKGWAHELEGAAGVVSCIGAFGSNAFMERINGDANAHAAEVAAKAGVERFVYVSTVENNLPDFVLKGYFRGKQRAEAAVLERFPSGKGVVLRPSFVYGCRQVGSLSLPLQLVGKPLELLFRLPPFPSLRQSLPGAQAVLAPPVAVQAVASVAAAAALGDERVKAAGGEGANKKGVLSVDEIARLARIV